MLAKTKPNKLSALDSLLLSFFKTLLLYQCLQIAIFASYALPYRFFFEWFPVFGITSFCFHIFLFFLLFVFRSDFVNDLDGKRLAKINLANAITLFRLSSLPTLLYILLANRTRAIGYPILILVIVIFASDFADGYISRRYKETTRAGKMMDSSGDYALLFVISLVFYYFRIIPSWYMWLFLFRLSSQFVMLVIVLLVKKQLILRTSFMGKAAVASTMVLYAFELLKLFIAIPMQVYHILEYCAGVIVALSVLDKFFIMIKDLRVALPAEKETGRLKTRNTEI